MSSSSKNMKVSYLSPVLLTLLLASCNISTNENELYFEIRNEDTNIRCNKKVNEVDLEIYEKYYIYFYIPKDVYSEVKDKTSLLSFEWNQNVIDIDYSSFINSTSSVIYSLTLKEVTSLETVKVFYNKEQYDLVIDVKDYSFSKESKVREDELETRYKDYKDMVDSISYHEYEEPYVGIDSFGASGTRKEYIYTYNFDEEYDLGYLKYLKDDSYYPSVFSLAKPNIVSSYLRMNFDDRYMAEPNSNKTTMGNFEISIGVIDPDCTNPTNPLRYLSFMATPKNYTSLSDFINRKNLVSLNQKYYLLSKKYQSKFTNYKVGELDITMIREKDYIIGFFEDETYLYTLSCSYEY